MLDTEVCKKCGMTYLEGGDHLCYIEYKPTMFIFRGCPMFNFTYNSEQQEVHFSKKAFVGYRGFIDFPFSDQPSFSLTNMKYDDVLVLLKEFAEWRVNYKNTQNQINPNQQSNQEGN